MMVGRGLVNSCAALLALLLSLALTAAAKAEDGYALWLRYAPLEGEALERLRAFNPEIGYASDGFYSTTTFAAARELKRGLESLRGAPLPKRGEASDSVMFFCGHGEDDGRFSVFSRRSGQILISAPGESGCLYGAFALLRELSLGHDPAAIDIRERPAVPLRLLNHWDNPDGTVERGYSGRSIFDWWRLPEHLDRRLIDYARANASIGINGTVVNNVNASSLFLTDRYIPKLKRVADALRPYGIRVYISARFSAPREVGGLETADPLDSQVQAWWKARADALYAAIPDFGGFLVKANSEGQPGPQDYGRTHADGANMMARAIGNRGTNSL